jgi:hypothetical protein
MGPNVTFVNNTAKSGGDKAYLADAPAAHSLFENSTKQATRTSPAPTAILQGSGRCTRQNVNKAGSALRVAGPPCALVLWSPAGGTLVPYVNNGSGLPTINATVVDCWCSTVQQIPGETAVWTHGTHSISMWMLIRHCSHIIASNLYLWKLGEQDVNFCSWRSSRRI